MMTNGSPPTHPYVDHVDAYGDGPVVQHCYHVSIRLVLDLHHYGGSVVFVHLMQWDERVGGHMRG
jgi:hypothetical protein